MTRSTFFRKHGFGRWRALVWVSISLLVMLCVVAAIANPRVPELPGRLVAVGIPGVAGVACYVSRAQTGGYGGAMGLAKDPSRFSVACRQIGTISFAKPLPRQEEVFKESASFIFKHVRVVRMVDAKRNTLVYLTYSDKLIDGSPDNAVTAVPVSGQNIPLK